MNEAELSKRFLNTESIPKAKRYVIPNPGFQMKTLMSNVDVTFFGGNAGAGKSFVELMCAMCGFYEPNFRAVYIRNTLKDVKSLGGLVDEAKKIYPEGRGSWRDTDPAQYRADSGCVVEFNHVQNQDMRMIEQIWKGRQLGLIAIDEITGIEFSTFQYLFSRNRHPGECSLKPQMIASCNPSSEHWIRTFIDWYIGEDGTIRRDRDGMVRYFFITGDNANSVVWGNSKQEVYNQCRDSIDPKLERLKKAGVKNLTHEDFIKSFTFIEGILSDNRQLISDDNKSYIANLSVLGDVVSSQLLGGNWNISSSIGEELITQKDLSAVFTNEPCISEKRCITTDLALKGGDSFVVMVWYGFHLVDIEAYTDCESDFVVSVIERLKRKHNVPETMIIYDDNGLGSFFSGPFKKAMPFLNNGKVINSENYKYLKDQCADKWSVRIAEGGYSIDERTAMKNFAARGMKGIKTLRSWLEHERRAFKWQTLDIDGKLSLIKKDDMKTLIGKSPDFTECWLMRELLELRKPFEIKNKHRLINFIR